MTSCVGIHLVYDGLVEADGGVCLKGHGHTLKQVVKVDSLAVLPQILIVTAQKTSIRRAFLSSSR